MSGLPTTTVKVSAALPGHVASMRGVPAVYTVIYLFIYAYDTASQIYFYGIFDAFLSVWYQWSNRVHKG